MFSAAAFMLLLTQPSTARAQTNVSLPDSAQTTTLTAAVAEQADVTVPGSVTIDVNDVTVANAETNLTLSISNIVLATATKQLRISLQANAATFTPPPAASNTWNASDVSWSFTGGSPWTNGTGSSGTLSHLSYNIVATCTAGAAACSTDRLKFALASNPSINRSGNYTLVVTWKFESIGT